MKPTIRQIIIFSLLLGSLTLLYAEINESLEPPIKYRLIVEGKPYTMIENEPLKIPGTLKDPTIKLEAEPNREFTYGGISFLYPKNFSFKADLSDTSNKDWTMVGNNLYVIYTNMVEELTLEEYVEALFNEFGKSNCKGLTNYKIELQGKQINVAKFNVAYKDIKIDIETFRLPSTEGTKLMYFQYSLNDTGKREKESIDAFNIIKKSIVVKK